MPSKKAQTDRKTELEKDLESIKPPSIEGTLEESAQNAEKKGDLAKMAYFYEQLVNKNPKNKTYKYKYAESARKLGNCQLALGIYKELLAEEPKNLDYMESKGLCLLANTEFKDAADIFTAVINADDTRWKSINGAGLIFALNKKYKEANEYLDLAAKISGNNPSVLNNQALIKAIIGNYSDSIKILELASAKASNDESQKRQIDLNLALVYGISGRLDDAEDTARPHLTEPQLYNNMGIYAELHKDKDLAKTYLNKALSGTPIYYDRAWENLERVEKGR